MSDDGLGKATLFDVFSNARRRMAVRYLIDVEGTCDLTPLVEQVAAWENGVGLDDVTRAQRRRVYISLYQTHLPMLADHGVIDWDPETHRITLRHDGRTFAPYLEQAGGARSWGLVYAGAAVGGAAGVSLAVLSVGPVTTAIAPTIAAITCLAVLVVVAVQVLSRRTGGLPSVGADE
ncbi:DUF7344 domain-containing protein [Halovivax cerinus]|uniref:DUF7344 domain-containing protein n=1 Tax=Halovivax cerinus TaxID=1487865 RepID=A0ABD5NMT9_9EURY|nr:hypothetical protein [Halovivax cerinus]